jgi:tRNA nucleotidyltransferase/poly(A) polymerase
MHNQIIHRLCQAGFEAFLVGGAVRDLLDNRTPNDFDVVTKATPDQIIRVFRGEQIKTVGKSFGVTIVNGIEIATFRTDHFPEANGASNCVPQFAETIHDDLSRRDFTINALALCPISGDVIDNFDGRSDLKNRVIRFVGDPTERILEDPNRIIRACRFVAKLEGSFDFNTLHDLRLLSHLVGRIKVERIAGELMKAMELDHPSLFFAALHTIGALDIVFPGMSASVFHDHGNHHVETIWDHMMLAGDSVSPRFPLVRLAAFLHDVGKPSSFDVESGSFLQHEHIGANLVDGWLRRLKFATADRELVKNLVRLHMSGASPGATPRAIRRFRKTLQDHNVTPQDWLRVRIADRKSNLNKTPFSFGDIRFRRGLFVDREEVLPFSVNSLALKGGDIIRIFELTPGPLVGVLQKHLLNFVIENGPEFNVPELLEEELRKVLEV